MELGAKKVIMRGATLLRVNLIVQLVSRVFPPSDKSACSQRQEFDESTFRMKRLKMCLYFSLFG
jgi:hypothetical protein